MKKQVLDFLLKHSETFRSLWADMAACHEDTKYHHGETTQKHTLAVVDSIDKQSAGRPAKERLELLLLGYLHDTGKPCRRTCRSDKGKIVFYGHAQASAAFVVKVLEEAGIVAPRVPELVRYHMDIFQALQTNEFRFLRKPDRLPLIDDLAIMAKADCAAINRDEGGQIDALVAKVKENV